MYPSKKVFILVAKNLHKMSVGLGPLWFGVTVKINQSIPGNQEGSSAFWWHPTHHREVS